MTHVTLDQQSEAVQRFFLSLAADPAGTMVELNGRVVACVVPESAINNSEPGEWNDTKNHRRWELIEKKHKQVSLSPTEVVELAQLQEEMLRFRQRIAPLPLEDARRLHDELLRKASGKKRCQEPIDICMSIGF
jgi:hypothetical protein